MRGLWDASGFDMWNRPPGEIGNFGGGGGIARARTYEGSYGTQGELTLRKAQREDPDYAFKLRALQKKFTPAYISDPLSVRANIFDEMGMTDPHSDIGMAQDTYMKLYGNKSDEENGNTLRVMKQKSKRR